MASLYPKKKSPFWFIEYFDPSRGERRNESTKLRRDSREETRKARQMCAQRTADELAMPGRGCQNEWEPWVSNLLAARYKNPLTLLRARQCWFVLSAYFRAKGIASPRLLTRDQCIGYIAWRVSDETKAFGLRKAGHNTAVLELKFLSAIMREAVLSGKTNANPAAQLGIGRVPAKRKPEITRGQQKIIEARLKSERGKYDYNEDMQIAWEIAMRYARRLTETAVRLDDVDLAERTVIFRNKGGEMKTKLLHPELVPLFRRLKKEKREYAHRIWPNWSKIWKYFFKRCKLPDLSFHSIRVTVVNELRRKRVDRRVTREFVDHSSVIVHEGYERWRPDDQIDAVNALSRGVVVLGGGPARSSNAKRRKRCK